MLQQDMDAQNTAFWDELCGSGLARSLGILKVSPENLRKFDEAYLKLYPYLGQYVEHEPIKGKKVLEIGLGFGTLGYVLAMKGCQYYGLDIAKNPVAMMRYRLSLFGEDALERVQEGSALHIPHPDSSFDFVYSVGCLHHTGNLAQAIAEVHRVLVPGGKAVIMLYHKHSYRQLVKVPLLCLRSVFRGWTKTRVANSIRALYDTNRPREEEPGNHSDPRSSFRRTSDYLNYIYVPCRPHLSSRRTMSSSPK